MPCGKLCSATLNWIKIVYQKSKKRTSLCVNYRIHWHELESFRKRSVNKLSSLRISKAVNTSGIEVRILYLDVFRLLSESSNGSDGCLFGVSGCVCEDLRRLSDVPQLR